MGGRDRASSVRGGAGDGTVTPRGSEGRHPTPPPPPPRPGARGRVGGGGGRRIPRGGGGSSCRRSAGCGRDRGPGGAAVRALSARSCRGRGGGTACPPPQRPARGGGWGGGAPRPSPPPPPPLPSPPSGPPAAGRRGRCRRAAASHWLAGRCARAGGLRGAAAIGRGREGAGRGRRRSCGGTRRPRRAVAGPCPGGRRRLLPPWRGWGGGCAFGVVGAG